MELTYLSLFSGIGGLDLAAEMAGFRTVGQCEWADYPTKVLEKHWPEVPRWRDIRTLTGDSFYERTGLRTVDVISGGFPCQPFSVAGKQRGKEDDRYLWPEMLRVISELRPAWVLVENVPGIIHLALDQVLSDLEAIGYAVQAFVVPAAGVDAPHRRERVAVVAHACCTGLERQQFGREYLQKSETRKKRVFGATAQCGAMDHTMRGRRQGKPWRWKPSEFADGCWWPAEPDVGRVAHGVPNRVDRLKCLGNAVVPQQFYPFFWAIREVELNGPGTDCDRAVKSGVGDVHEGVQAAVGCDHVRR